MRHEPAAAIAAIANACWWVRHYRRAHQRADRAAALVQVAAIASAALGDPSLAEPVLYAIAVGLYDPDDPRFTP